MNGCLGSLCIGTTTRHPVSTRCHDSYQKGLLFATEREGEAARKGTRRDSILQNYDFILYCEKLTIVKNNLLFVCYQLWLKVDFDMMKNS